MLLSDRNIKVLNSDVEGTTQLVEVTPIKLVPVRIVLGILLSITILFPLLMSWSTLLLKKFFFVECSLDDATHVWVQNSDLQKGISKLIRSQQVSFMNRKLRYVYQYGRFVPLQYEPPIKRELLKYNGCDNVEYNRDLYGRCLIVIPKPNIFIYLLKELTTPFYVLQYASCVLWTLEGFAGLAIIMLCVSLLITTINFFLLQNASSKLREMARNKQIVSVKRHGQFVQIDSDDLVPGDLIAIQNKSKIPCDCVLVSGDLLMNEASLTGESIPIPKVPVEEKDEKVSFVTDKRNCLFEGTKVLVAKPDQDQHHVLAVVARTGFISFKGQIFRAVLYPKQTEFAFYRQAIKFLCYLVIFVLIIYFAELYKLIQLGYSFSVLMYRFLDAITWVIPPALPIFISMCMTFSLVRLKRINIFGIDPQKSLIAGKVNTICFDKTGTLTTIGIDVFGYMSSQECRFNNFRSIVESDRTEFIFKLFATCHGTYIIDGEMMGDSLDIEMFKYSEYQVLQDDTCKFAYQKDDSTLKVMKLYEFESALQRMSVLVQDGNNYYVFVKGSPEKIEELSTFGIPVDYKRQLELLTLKGLRIIALGYRKLKQEEFQKLLKGFRNDCEQNLTFVGLLAMENKLKSDTKDVINNLYDSGLDLKIISGDNPLTTVQCARECGILKNKPVLLIDYDDKTKQLVLEEIQRFENLSDLSYGSQITTDSVTTTSHKEVMEKLVSFLLTTHPLNQHNESQDQDSQHQHQKFNNDYFSYAISGKAFDYFWEQNPKDDYFGRRASFAGEQPIGEVEPLKIQGLDYQLQQQLFAAIISNTKVFARMRPEQKSQIIEQLQKFNKTVVMIGDGANDCAAIKQANVGISFAQSDASYSAPYSSYDDSISCVQKILLDGRCSLQNACDVFLFYITANIAKYIGVMIIMAEGQNFDTFEFVFLNYVGSIPFLVAISLTKPLEKLSSVIPLDNMMAKQNILAIMSNTFIIGVGLLINYGYWSNQSWSDSGKFKIENGTYKTEGQIQTSLFLLIMVYCEFAVISIFTSIPFKIRIYQHKLLMVLLALLTVFLIWLSYLYQQWQVDLLSMVDNADHKGYQTIQLIIAVIFGQIMIFWQEFFIRRYYPQHEQLKNILKKNQVA